MKHKCYKLLSLGLCFSMMASTLAYAAPVQKQMTRMSTRNYESVSEQNEVSEDAELEDYELGDVRTATPGEAERMTFMDYFPDPNFAQEVAEYLRKNKEDYVTVDELQSITELWISGRRTSDLTGIENLMCLQSLDLSGNPINEIPDGITNLSNLKSLSLRECGISEIPDSMSNLSNLESLDLCNNQISEIPDSMSNLSNLESLDLCNNQISEIPDSIADLSNLQRLNLFHNRIREIPDSFGDLSNLKFLTLNQNPIGEIPDGITNLANLEYLDLGWCGISEIPDSMSNLSNLESLDLNCNQIREVLNSFGVLSNLKSLDLSSNRLSELPDSITNLSNLERLNIYGNQIREIPDSIASLPNLQFLNIRSNRISSEIPENILLAIDTYAANQYAYLASLSFVAPNTITYEQLTSQLILQAQRYNGGILRGEWRIICPDGEVITISGGDGSEISHGLFRQKGKYTISFCWNASASFPDFIYDWIDPLNFNSTIQITVQNVDTHTVTLTTRYLDNALPESTQSYSVEDATRFEQPFEVLDGYGLSGMELFTMPDFDVDMDTRTVFIDPVTQDYNIVLEFEKLPVKENNVTVITRYLDDALPEHTKTYTVPRGSAFLESFEILDGYELISTELRNMPEFDVDMENKTVSLDPVNQDHTILLEFDKQINKVKLTTRYLDGHLPEASQVARIRYGDPYSQTYEIAAGYQIANLDQLPAGVTVDEANQTVTISSVTEPYDILLEFEKKQFQVTITVIYEDGAYEDQITTHSVAYGDPLETSFLIDEDYIISRVSFNAMGVSVNKNQQTVKIRSVTSPIQITIRVK